MLLGKDDIILNADQLGSGVHNLFKYSKYYSGKEPEFVERDVFKIIVPLDDKYSFDFDWNKQVVGETKNATNATKDATSATNLPEIITKRNLTADEKKIISLIKEEPAITQKELHEKSEISLGTIKRILPRLQKKGIISRIGNNRSGQWQIHEKSNESGKKDI